MNHDSRTFMFNRLIIVFLGVIGVNFFLKVVLILVSNNSLEQELIFGISRKSTLILVTLLLLRYIKKPKLNQNITNWQIDILSIFITLFYFGFYFSQLSDNRFHHLLLVISQIETGIFEEFLFRVIIFHLIYCLLCGQAHSKLISKASIIASILFGLAHFSNLIEPNTAFLSIINQSIFAYCLGIIFQVIFLKARSITIVICLHSIYDHFVSRDTLFEHGEVRIDTNNHTILDIVQSIGIFAFLALIITVIGLGILKTVKRNNISCK